MFSLFNI
jgi:pseudouridine-5'-phosphate glycosidase